jgi:molybdate transport system substrate-binding protein
MCDIFRRTVGPTKMDDYNVGMIRAQMLLFLFMATLFGCGRFGCSRSSETSSAKRSLTVAAAADLKFALDEAIRLFRPTNPDLDIKVIYGSSGSFYTQVTNGAPFDMFMSADMEYPNRLQKAGLAIPGTEFEYAVGRIVVWVPKGSPLDVGKLGINALADPSVKHVAIANPQHAPYGRAAVAAMQSLGVYENVKTRFVLGENVSQTLEFIDSGGAQIGIIAMSLASPPTVKAGGRYWEIPLNAYPRMDQGGVILQRVKDKHAAEQLRSFILGTQGRAVFKQFGFYLPEESK